MAGQTYRDGDTETINGVPYTRQGGRWIASQQAQPPSIITHPADPLARETARVRLEGERLTNRERALRINQMDPTRAAGGIDPALTGPAALDAMTPADRRMVQSMIDGRVTLPTQGRMATDANWQRWMALAQQVDPQIDQNTIRNRQNAQHAFLTGPQGQNVTSFNTALGHLSSLDQAIDHLDNFHNLPIGNYQANEVRNMQGSRAAVLSDFDARANAAAAELTRAFRGTGGGEADVQAWRRTLDPNSSADALHAAVAAEIDLLGSRIRAQREAYRTAMGRPDASLPLLTPEAQQILSSYGHDDLADPSAANRPAAGPSASPSRGGTVSVLPPEPGMDRTTRQTGVNPADPLTLSHGDTVADPGRVAVNAQIQRRLSNMLYSGATPAQMHEYGATVGMDPASINAALTYSHTADYRRWRRENPHALYPFSAPAERPMGAVEGAQAAFGASAPGAALIHAGNAVVPTSLVAHILGGDPEQARLGVEAVGNEHPYAALGGDIGGAAIAYGAGGKGASLIADRLATAAPRLSRFLQTREALPALADRTVAAQAQAREAALAAGATPADADIAAQAVTVPRGAAPIRTFTPRALAGDATYGAVQGEGKDGDPFMGALEGVGGGIFGRGVMRAAGRALAPTGGRVADLYGIGVNPSPGQRFGGVINQVEQRMQDIPIIGEAIRGTRQGARDQFQTGLFNDALGHIGQTLPDGAHVGPDAHAFSQNAFNDAYDTARSGMTYVHDAPAASDLGAIQQSVGQLRPDSRDTFNTIWRDAVTRRMQPGGVLSGDAYKSAVSEIGQRIRGIRGNQTGDGELADALQSTHDMLAAGARRNSPADAVAAMDNADAGYARLVRIEDASRRRGGDVGEFSPTQYDAATQNMSNSVRDREYLRGDALNSNLAQQGKHLADTVPDSGTNARRLNMGLINAVTGTAGYTFPTTTAAALAPIALAYSPLGRGAMTSAMAPRAEDSMAQWLGEYLRRNARWGSRAGPLTVDETGRQYSQAP